MYASVAIFAASSGVTALEVGPFCARLDAAAITVSVHATTNIAAVFRMRRDTPGLRFIHSLLGRLDLKSNDGRLSYVVERPSCVHWPLVQCDPRANGMSRDAGRSTLDVVNL